MLKKPGCASARASFSLRLGRALEAHATGWGILAVPLALALLLTAALISAGALG